MSDSNQDRETARRILREQRKAAARSRAEGSPATARASGHPRHETATAPLASRWRSPEVARAVAAMPAPELLAALLEPAVELVRDVATSTDMHTLRAAAVQRELDGTGLRFHGLMLAFAKASSRSGRAARLGARRILSDLAAPGTQTQVRLDDAQADLWYEAALATWSLWDQYSRCVLWPRGPHPMLPAFRADAGFADLVVAAFRARVRARVRVLAGGRPTRTEDTP